MAGRLEDEAAPVKRKIEQSEKEDESKKSKIEVESEPQDDAPNNTDTTVQHSVSIADREKLPFVKQEIESEPQDDAPNNTDTTVQHTDRIADRENVSEKLPLVKQVKEEFLYTVGDKFTSEIFKVELQGLPDRLGYGQLKKKLKVIGVEPVKIKFPGRSFCFMTFRNEDEQLEAIKLCDGFQWKGKTMKALKSLPTADPYVMKKKQEAGRSRNRQGNNEEDESLSVSERLQRAVTPLVHIPYEDQVKKKEEDMHEYLKKLGNVIGRNNIEMVPEISDAKKKYAGLCCEVLPIKSSPVLSNYRNKCEFTIGKSPEGEEKTIGFRLSSYKAGSISVADPKDCVHIPDAMKAFIMVMQDYLRTLSTYAAFDPETKDGNWHVLTCRTTLAGRLMAGVHFFQQKTTDNDITAEMDKLKDYFVNGLGKSCGVDTLYFQVVGEKGFNLIRRDVLIGNGVITEELLGLSFRISPGAFFQINSKAAEVLYTTIAEFVSVTPETVILDVCCGTGTIGLTLAKHVKKVYGIEMCEEAVDDAKANAVINDISNVEFICGKAETVMPSLMSNMSSSDPTVAILDPPRSGTHVDVIRTVRRTPNIKTLVYVSCNPAGAMQNLTDLTRLKSKRFTGSPFSLKKAVPIDMFPHTPHCELLLLLQRD